ncbi:unnamed protein product, partial [Pylaiella littoralis]
MLSRRAMTLCARDARQRFLIAKRAMANNEIRKRKSARDRLFAELVYKRIFMRTGGVVRTWTTIIAHVKRLRFLEGAVERAGRQKRLELNENRLAIVTKFLCHMVLKRRRNRAVKVMVGALSAFTNSNAIGRYARRVHWGSRRLQAVVRGRIACMSSHLALLNRQWDRLHPPIPVPQTIAVSAMSSPPLSTALPVSLPDVVEGKVTGEATSPNGSKRPARRKGAGGQGGQKKGKGRKSQQSVVAVGKAGASGRGGGGGRGQAAAVRKAVSMPDNDSSAPTEAKRRGRPPPHVSSKAKHDEIISWLQRTRSKHCKDVINYERFTIFPCMVELLLQHERTVYRTRLQAINHVTALQRSGRLSHAWTEKGYYAKMSHVLPPPPRMPRIFTPEEGDAMFDRAAARSAGLSSVRASAASLLAEEPDSLAVDESDSGKNIHGSAPSESALIELETGAAALAMATAAGEAAM